MPALEEDAHPRRTAAGEQRSFEDFYVEEYVAVVRFAYALTGRLALAEELSQDGFVAAFRRWQRVGAYDDPGGWVRRVVSHRAISAWRRSVTEARTLARLRRERTRDAMLPESDEELWKAVRRLPGRQRQVITLVVLEDRSVTDVAALLRCSEDTVRTHLRRAREKLSRDLAKGGAES